MITIKNIAARALLVSAGAIFYSNAAWALLPIQHWTEPSGAKVYLVESPVIPMVDVQIDFDAGTRRDPAGQSGLATAVAAMASKGVKALGAEPALDENGLGEAWADLGASFEAGADNDALHYTLRSLTDPPLLDKAARLAARQMGEPSFPADVWPRDRARWSASLKESLTRPSTVAAHAFGAAVYGSHPYGTRTTEETLARINVADMQTFHTQHIAACRAKVSIVGAVSRAQAQALVATLLSRLPATTGCAPLPPVGEISALAAPVEQNIPFASAQAHVLIGQPGFQRRDPDFVALLVGNHILGGGFVSRLTNEVREKRGLSYRSAGVRVPSTRPAASTSTRSRRAALPPSHASTPLRLCASLAAPPAVTRTSDATCVSGPRTRGPAGSKGTVNSSPSAVLYTRWPRPT